MPLSQAVQVLFALRNPRWRELAGPGQEEHLPSETRGVPSFMISKAILSLLNLAQHPPKGGCSSSRPGVSQGSGMYAAWKTVSPNPELWLLHAVERDRCPSEQTKAELQHHAHSVTHTDIELHCERGVACFWLLPKMPF